jgi:hypothetical protein
VDRKYCRNMNILHTDKSHASPFWKGVILAAQALKFGYRWVVGNGKIWISMGVWWLKVFGAMLVNSRGLKLELIMCQLLLNGCMTSLMWQIPSRLQC